MEVSLYGVKKDKKPNVCRFLYACKKGDLGYVEEYLVFGGNVNATSPVKHKSGIMYALENKNYNVATFLLYHNIDLSIKDTQGKTANDYANADFKEILAHSNTKQKD